MTVEQVQQEVHRFWKAFSANDAQTLADFYSTHATVFNSTGRQPEPGPVSAARCYFEFDFSLAVELGDIQVQLLGVDAGSAVASYTLRLRRDLARNPLVNDLLENEESLIEYGRVSQVFTVNAGGRPWIVHEHLSLPEAGRWEKQSGKSLLDLVRIPA